MGHILNSLERQQMQLWSLIDAYMEMKSSVQQEQEVHNDMIDFWELIDQYEMLMWQTLLTQSHLQRKFMGIQADEDVNNESEMPIEAPGDGLIRTIDEEFLLTEFETPAGDENLENSNIGEPLRVMKEESSDRNCNLVLNHSGDSTFAPNKSDLASSELRKSSYVTRSFKCKKCNKKFVKNSTYLTHMKHHRISSPKVRTSNHSNGKRFTCSSCNFFSNRKENLVRHERVMHMGEKLYACDKCEKTFSFKCSLGIHMKRLHSDTVSDTTHDSDVTRPFKCLKCNRQFVKRHAYLLHMRHHGVSSRENLKEKLFSCSSCNYFSKRKENVVRHEKVMHTDEKPYACGQCEEAFSYKRFLAAHMKRFHPDTTLVSNVTRPFKCLQCYRRFMNKAAYLSHLRHHRVSTYTYQESQETVCL